MKKKAFGFRDVPTYSMPGQMENTWWEGLNDDKNLGDERPIGGEYPDNQLYDAIDQPDTYANNKNIKKQALDYHDFNPFTQHQLGLGYDGSHQFNRSEFPRFHPTVYNKDHYIQRLEDGDYPLEEYSESNPNLFPKRDEGQKYLDFADGEGKAKDENKHFFDHYKDQSRLQITGCKKIAKYLI